MVATTEFDRAKMLAAAPLGFSLATEIADFLVRAHIPFAEAHEAAGKCVALCEKNGIQLDQLTDDQFKSIHAALTPEVRQVLTVEGAISSRTTLGATGPTAFAEQIKAATENLSKVSTVIAQQQKRFSEMMGA
jgi:argininosuccinate lyase